MATTVKSTEELLESFRLSEEAKAAFAAAGVTVVAGDKGGVGKSAFTKACADGRDEAGLKQIIIDADKGIQDVAKQFGQETSCDLNGTKGFRDLYSALTLADKDRPVIVSTPGGLVEKALQHAPQFLDVLPQLSQALKRPVRVAWVIDEKRDGLEKLREFREATRNRVVIDVVKNEFFAPSDEFHLFDRSQERLHILKNGGQILRLPSLDRTVMTQITVERRTRKQALETLDLFDRAAYDRWWDLTAAELRGAGYIP